MSKLTTQSFVSLYPDKKVYLKYKNRKVYSPDLRRYVLLKEIDFNESVVIDYQTFADVTEKSRRWVEYQGYST